MKKRFQPNIGWSGRVLRGLIGLTLRGIALAAWRDYRLAGAGLAAGGVFCLLEALRGWCVARACSDACCRANLLLPRRELMHWIEPSESKNAA